MDHEYIAGRLTRSINRNDLLPKISPTDSRLVPAYGIGEAVQYIGPGSTLPPLRVSAILVCEWDAAPHVRIQAAGEDGRGYAEANQQFFAAL